MTGPDLHPSPASPASDASRSGAAGAPPSPQGDGGDASGGRGGARGAGGPFGEIRSWGVTRSTSDRWFGGVCSGVAHRAGVDPILVRAGVITLTLLGGFGVAAYVLAWLLLPDERGGILLENALGGVGGQGEPASIAAIAVLVAVAIGWLAVGDQGWWFGFGTVPVLALVGLWLYARHQGVGITDVLRRLGSFSGAQAAPPPPTGGTGDVRAPMADQCGPQAATPGVSVPAEPTSTPSGLAPSTDTYATGPARWTPPAAVGSDAPPPPPPWAPAGAPAPTPTALSPATGVRHRPRVSGPALAAFAGLALAAYGIGYAVAHTVQFAGSAHLLGLMLALGVTSLGAVLMGLAGRRSPLLAIAVIVLALSVSGETLGARIGLGTVRSEKVTWTPTALGGPHDLGSGDAVLDLRSLPTGTTGQLPVTVGAGKLTVLVPSGARVRVDYTVGAGSVVTDVPGGNDTRSDGGLGVENEVDYGGGTPALVVQAEVGLGSLRIVEQGS